MKLNDLARALAGVAPPDAAYADIEIAGVTHNSAWVQPGFLFVALRGARHDGHAFIPEAIARGAVAIAGEGHPGPTPPGVPYLRLEHARRGLARIAALLVGEPARQLTLVGVTGTKGKTTTAWLTRHLLRAAGRRVGLLSTLGYKLEDDALHHFPAHFTTPEAPQVHETLARLVARDGTHAVIEASSEALAQDRLWGLSFAAAAWTNLSPEHLNFHGDMEGYFAAKRLLIDAADFAVLNAEDPWAQRLTDRPHATYAAGGGSADWRALRVTERDGGLRFDVRYPGGQFAAQLPMIGRYNVANALAAIALAHRLGVAIAAIQAALPRFAGVPGRMQVLQATPVRVVLDFAHTPDSLKRALQSLRPTTRGRLVVVIGSAGGPRDPGKRAPLGAVAATLADHAVFTEEDCRDTPIEAILAEMERGAREAGKRNYTLIPDRYRAIRQALADAQPGDTVVLCGKAGEETLERADALLPWDEEQITRQVMAELWGEAPA